MRVIVAFAAFSYLLVMLRMSVHASLRVSPDLISFQLNLREALHDSRWSSFHVATTLSHKRSWLSDTFTCTPPKMFISLVLRVIWGEPLTTSSCMSTFLTFPASSFTDMTSVPSSLSMVHEATSVPLNDNSTAHSLLVSSVHAAIAFSPIYNMLPLMRTGFPHVTSTLEALRVMVGGVTSFSSSVTLSLLHAESVLAAVQTDTSTGDMEPTKIHATTRALLTALPIVAMSCSVLL